MYQVLRRIQHHAGDEFGDSDELEEIQQFQNRDSAEMFADAANLNLRYAREAGVQYPGVSYEVAEMPEPTGVPHA